MFIRQKKINDSSYSPIAAGGTSMESTALADFKSTSNFAKQEDWDFNEGKLTGSDPKELTVTYKNSEFRNATTNEEWKEEGKTYTVYLTNSGTSLEKPSEETRKKEVRILMTSQSSVMSEKVLEVPFDYTIEDLLTYISDDDSGWRISDTSSLFPTEDAGGPLEISLNSGEFHYSCTHLTGAGGFINGWLVKSSSDPYSFYSLGDPLGSDVVFYWNGIHDGRR